MRINQFVARATGLSRRAADAAISTGRVRLNDQTAQLGNQVTESDRVSLDDTVLNVKTENITIMLNKPVGYVCSRDGQGSKTIYELLPNVYQHLKPIGRLDKDSSGLLLLTSDGNLAYQLTHPSFQKEKRYEVELDQPLTDAAVVKISGEGVMLEDGPSRLQLKKISDNRHWVVAMSEGRNRQIRRTFTAVGIEVRQLHRIQFGPYTLPQDLTSGNALTVTD